MSNLAHAPSGSQHLSRPLSVVTSPPALRRVVASMPHARVVRDGDTWSVQVSIEPQPTAESDWRIVYRTRPSLLALTPRKRVEHSAKDCRRESMLCMRYASEFWSVYAFLYREGLKRLATGVLDEMKVILRAAYIALAELEARASATWKKRIARSGAIPYVYVKADEHFIALTRTLLGPTAGDPYALLPALNGSLGPHYERN